ncbi:hypothetical protein FACS189475_02310 [Betaproteobacteria bacterium]|nr:hypothetical protein FACS189475_02310 [Betaproteobacteria bacterium]
MFTCVLDGNHQNENPWRILAINKFKQPVALAKFHKNNGLLVILPQVRDKVAFLERLFAEVLPEMTPHLFPSIEKSKWNHLPEYELPHIIELKARQDNIASKAKKDIADLENEITQENTINGWIHDLLTGTDTKLVVAIKNVFEAFGFEKIIDVDVERDKEGKSRREDLQIQDQSPLLIVDIKGIAAFPHDEDVLQADKHATLRMRELKRVDVVGLSIINHQRHIPPLDRNNVMPFRQELLDIAEEHTLGLMTSWDLYCLYRNFNKLNWSSEQVKPLFYKKGRIFPVPVHYCYIGTIAKAWTDKFGVMIEEGEVSVGDRLAVEFPIEFQEINVNSIRVNNDGVEHVKVGDPAGFLSSDRK